MAQAFKAKGPRGLLWAALEPEVRPGAQLSWLNWLLVLLVIVSFALLSIETELAAQRELLAAGQPVTAWAGWIGPLVERANFGILAVFAAEYAVRLMVCGVDPRYRGLGGALRYARQPSSIADLLAFAPELAMTLTAPQGAQEWLPALRMLRLMRLFKLARYFPALDIIVCAARRARSQLLVTLLLAGSLLFVAAAVLHFIEGGAQPQTFGSIPRALWWSAVTLTTIGYGDVYPITVFGRIAAAITALLGIAVVALPTGIFAAAISDELKERAERSRG